MIRSCVIYSAYIFVLAILTYYVATSWDTLHWPANISYGWLFASCFAGFIGLLLFAIQGQCLLHGHGYSVSKSESIGLLYAPMIGKYVPGKVWAIALGVYIYGWFSVPNRVAASCIGLSMLLGLATAAVIILLLGNQVAAFGLLPFSIVLGAVGVLVLRPSLVYASANWVLKFMGRPVTITPLSQTTLGAAILLNLCAWLFVGSGFACLVWSVSDFDAHTLGLLITAYLSAQIIGIVAFFAPAGIGVREAVVVVALEPMVGNGRAIVIAALARLWQSGIELLLIAYGWRAIRHAKPEGDLLPESRIHSG